MIGLGLNIRHIKNFGSIGSKYISRANVDGGSGGNGSCANVTFKLLKAIASLGFLKALSYITLANADGGSEGSVSCAETTFKSLLDI